MVNATQEHHSFCDRDLERIQEFLSAPSGVYICDALSSPPQNPPQNEVDSPSNVANKADSPSNVANMADPPISVVDNGRTPDFCATERGACAMSFGAGSGYPGSSPGGATVSR
jgi:hypothetical protein